MGLYIRKDRKRSGRVYYYLVSSERHGQKVVQRRFEYLGASPTDKEIAEARAKIARMLGTPRDGLSAHPQGQALQRKRTK